MRKPVPLPLMVLSEISATLLSSEMPVAKSVTVLWSTELWEPETSTSLMPVPAVLWAAAVMSLWLMVMSWPPSTVMPSVRIPVSTLPSTVMKLLGSMLMPVVEPLMLLPAMLTLLLPVTLMPVGLLVKRLARLPKKPVPTTPKLALSSVRPVVPELSTPLLLTV